MGAWEGWSAGRKNPLLLKGNHLHLDFSDPSCFSAFLRPRTGPDSFSQLQTIPLVSQLQAPSQG